MKQKISHHTASHQPMYPNAADSHYLAERALEILTAILTGAGAIALMIALMIMA